MTFARTAIARSSGLLRPATAPTRAPAAVGLHLPNPAFARRFASDEPPRSQERPAQGGNVKKDNSMLMIGALGLGLGAFFFMMLGRPEKAAETSKFGRDRGEHNTGSGTGSQTGGSRAA
ncbi:hypothetical protein DL768_003322 [Monosporascus sp. mg162]|nr:hypothetical protein DL768_003322 [Monosporascus sp. mg162]